MPFTHDGIAITANGEVQVTSLASGTAVPATAIKISGTGVPAGKMLAVADQSLYVRFV